MQTEAERSQRDNIAPCILAVSASFVKTMPLLGEAEHVVNVCLSPRPDLSASRSKPVSEKNT
ncbi:hypothetical protein EYF80_014451 [Liparis tanakae]|uniref:Uncharacterized protein n=1 Tax=Liparis tanakae TaxID=230148 RepID=A0A4Z2IDD9_9TELE|nr:hypothetical protein EYF80_014451 [Liparis tanakae]